jgi:hypothetical protein
MLRHYGGCRTTLFVYIKNWKELGNSTIGGDSPVQVIYINDSGILSSAGPEKSRMNLPAPSGKAKYSRKTDSEQVP